MLLGARVTGALVGVGLLTLGALVPRSAAAQMLKCESHALSVDDEASLRAKARAVLPSGTRIEAVDACRNPNSAIGWILTRKTITPESVSQWWEFSCRREAVVWGCDAPEFKQFVGLTLLVGDRSRHVELSFGEGITLESTRTLASRALDLYSDPASTVPACGAKERKETDRLGARSSRSSLPEEEKPIHLTVAHTVESESATLDDVGVDIEFPLKPSDGASEGACWYEVIIVT
jgi:hypothetical protein